MLQTKVDIQYHDERFLMFVLDQMAHDYERQGKDVIRMTLGKSELPVREEITAAMVDALRDFSKSALVYPGGLPQLKEALAKHYEERYDLRIPPNNFVISVGTSTLFRNLFQVLLKEGDEVLLPYPYYSLYHFCALLAGASIKYYSIDPKSMRLDYDSFKRGFSERTKVVVINSPGNPLGNVLTREDLYGIDEIVGGRAFVINDEIYANISFDEKGESVMQLENTKSTFITTNAFSKGYRMYSRRVGYCIVPDELVTPLTVIQHHTLLTLDPVVQFGAIEALRHQEDVTELEHKFRIRRDYTIDSFNRVPLVEALYSKGGFYIVLECDAYMKARGIATSLELAERIMEATSVATVPGSDFGLPTCLRLSFSSERYKVGIDRLVSFFLEA
jgi:aspartate/methionine/tyrosine aminotransferase